MDKNTSSSKYLINLFLDLDFHKPLREMVGSLIHKICGEYDLEGIAIEIVTLNDISFFIFASKDENWNYYEGNDIDKYPLHLKKSLDGISKAVFLDGDEKGNVYIDHKESSEIDSLLTLVSGIVKKKLIWDRDLIDEQCRTVERILRKGNHDIRSPFFGVSGFAQLINQKTNDPEIKGYCKTMLESLERVESVMTELVSGLGEKPLRMRPETFSISKMVGEIAEKSKEMYARCNIELNFSNEANFYVSADPELIKNAIYGILNNAREELIDGGTINISLNYGDENKKVELSIKDSGKGVPADIIDSIFKPIFKYGKGDDHLGLGLSNSLNIVKSHGGDIRIKNNCEKNTEFVIDLPLAEKED